MLCSSQAILSRSKRLVLLCCVDATREAGGQSAHTLSGRVLWVSVEDRDWRLYRYGLILFMKRPSPELPFLNVPNKQGCCVAHVSPRQPPCQQFKPSLCTNTTPPAHAPRFPKPSRRLQTPRPTRQQRQKNNPIPLPLLHRHGFSRSWPGFCFQHHIRLPTEGC